ncbi:MAG: HAD-IC family P-type ATPase, partial [Candidatus Nanogingivalis sp.]
MKHIQTIIFRNFISPISIAIFILAGGLLLVGEVRDAWFISFVILVNSFIGTIQEVRAYLTLRKIELMSAPRAMVFRDGKLEEILFTELQQGDEIFLKTGDEIPADAKITKSNSFEVNESILTGESDAISKNVGDKILSSSIVVSGEAEAEVLAVGENTEAGQMAAKLKNYKPKLTPIQQKISKLISRLSWFALALAIVICLVYFFIFKEDPTTILKTITSAAVVVVPEGLLLASSLFFAYGSLKLLQAKVLPQKISAIEDMALLEVLATDKTGTLTSPEIEFNSCEVISKDFSKEEIAQILNTLNSEPAEKNATAQAILNEFKDNINLKITDYMAFSSSRKLSGMTFIDNNKEESIVFGAPEFILKNLSEDSKSESISKEINNLASQGLRVLLLAKFKKSGKISKLLESEKLEPIAIITLKNTLRPNVQETVSFLQNRGVSIRVISGDNPRTVSFIALEAGIKNAEKYITGAELANLSKKDFEKAVLENTIFARVLPEQKEKIIGVFQKNNLYTGMIGDGVNDALAIKKSDLGISMFDGAPATRRVADLVLMDNSFTSLPSGVKIGNRIMLSIEMIAILFFHKIIL